MPLYQNYISDDQLTDLKFILSLIRAEIHPDQADKIRGFLKQIRLIGDSFYLLSTNIVFCRFFMPI